MDKYQYQIIRLLLIAITISLCFSSCSYDEKNTGDKIAYGSEFATWSRSIFFRGYSPTSGEALTFENIQDYANILKTNKIKYAYIFSGPYDLNGSLPDWAFSETARKSILEIKKFYPDIKILPWVGGVDGKTVNLKDSNWRTIAINSTMRLLNTLPVDGIHVDFEKFATNNPYLVGNAPAISELSGKEYSNGLIEFHRKLRELKPDLFVSSVVVSTASQTQPWKRKHSLEELKQLFPLVNQISFLFYDTSIKDQSTYRISFIEQLNHIKYLKEQATGVKPQVLIGIGTFINEPELRPYRNMEIENIPNTLKVIKEGIAELSTKERLVDGLAFYCEWQTDENEWAMIKNNW
jgi:hypothetical protein